MNTRHRAGRPPQRDRYNEDRNCRGPNHQREDGIRQGNQSNNDRNYQRGERGWRNHNKQGEDRRNRDEHRRQNDRPDHRDRRQNDMPNHRERPNKIMGFRFLEAKLKDENIGQVMMDLSNDRSGFLQLLESKDISPDIIVLLVKLFKKICGSTFFDVKVALLSSAIDSRFIEKLTVFITNIMNQTSRNKTFNKYFWEDPDDFWESILTFCKTVQEILPSKCEPLKITLKNMSVFFPLIENAHSMHISDNIKAQTLSLLDIVEKTIVDMEVKKMRIATNVLCDEESEPPNDFREIEIIPTAEEIVSESSPYLRANIVDKAYNSITHYLDIQFRLLREDFVAPLRRGITTFLRNQNKPKKEWKKLDDIKIYHPIKFLSIEAVNESNCYKLQFDFSNKKKSFTYENSKRFMFGSLVCFTSDNFQNVIFGKIVDRDKKLLEQSLLIVGFDQDIQIDFETDYLMVESTVYFEPYYQALNVLKHMKTDVFPMERYIIKVQRECHRPQYLEQHRDHQYLIDGSSEQPFYFLSPKRFYGLNDSQLEAFAAAITNEFSIIQGPPGTGKTYLGLKIAHTLLANRAVWFRNTPILVICYTNHALDQFLEGLLPVTEKILRVGGQSKNENLKRFNISHKRKMANKQAAAIHQRRREVRDLMGTLKNLYHIQNEIEKCESVVDFSCFENVIENYRQTWFFTATSSQITNWLLEGKFSNQFSARPRNQRQVLEAVQNLNIADNDDEAPEDVDENQPNGEWLDDIFSGIDVDVYRPIISLQQLRDKLKCLDEEAARLQQESTDMLDVMLRQEQLEEEIYNTEMELKYLEDMLKGYHNPRNRRKPKVNHDLSNPFLIYPPDRWHLYFYWLNQYSHQIRRKYQEVSIKFRQVCRLYNQMRDIEDMGVMRENLVVGMTTTGAARLQSSLQELKSPIVIVEEAAEVLEAHIVAALTSHCEHLILIGDHLQLKPGAADYRIETKYKLGISLFERMVLNNIRCHTLNVQHRMRPEISQLIKPHIYEHLIDHNSTLQRAPILGVEKSLYFVNHQESEDLCQDESKKNVHESKFLIGLARHLILNGYKPEQVTILAAYLGQFFEMTREKNKPGNRMLLQDVRISVLDNYQGEESDIILLSLVRSNKDNKAGFLRIQNRVCVALSRARDGFYIMGNMRLLLNCDSENEIWPKVNEVLKSQSAIGTHLTLRCQIHSNKLTRVSKGQDFDRLSEGGCDELCLAPLGCGHVCKRLCHVQDRNHILYKCNDRCMRILCNDPNHVCKKLCYEECGQCTYLVWRHLDCGHDVPLQCHINPNTYGCKEPVLKKLPCEHETRVPCSMDPAKFRCPFPCDIRVEPCGHACERKCHIGVDPDHLEYKCKQFCEKPRKDCNENPEKHKCTRLCYQDCEDCTVSVRKDRSCGHVFLKMPCKLNIEEFQCDKPCKKTLPCGHPCRSKCFEECAPCQVKVDKILEPCQHSVKVRCHETPTRKMCKSKDCPRRLPCGHKCTEPCSRNCTEVCKEMVECSIPSPCGHNIKRIMCYLRNTVDEKILLMNCSEPCQTELKCAHLCTGTCGECMQGRIHIRCKSKCSAILVCNHECPIPCRESCKPCTKPCEMRCKHTKCKKLCGQPCTPCAQPCERRCKHQQCTKRCGEICDVPPCGEHCEKLLKCNHPCVGFCGDPCPPLCRECNKDELTETFFGTEDEEDAIFVYLNDCKHTLESTGLETWMNSSDDKIQLKSCPMCKTSIRSTERYSHYVKQALNDVIEVKIVSYGDSEQNENMRRALLDDINRLEKNCSRELMHASPQLSRIINAIKNRLGPVRNQRRQAINKIELNALKSKIQALGYITKYFDSAKDSLGNNKITIHYMEVLFGVLQRSEDYITNQEVEDLQLEINCFHRIVQFEKIKASPQFRFAKGLTSVTQLTNAVVSYLFTDRRYNDIVDKTVKELLKSLSKKVECAVTISDQEKMEIVKAIGLTKGHWYKCPNGHPYAIGECGGAMQVSKCFCGAKIGGSDHHLLPTNSLATEMDGATHSAWPGGLY
ncbi:NFX1-type zinc finger-containing protein 1-like [Anthonomus grandis grandis]|uniref:NFX1-type zinc finger-containing protein 1-like n=1 Tax=Anthonomus grandis grandis TaxID=2921223 RepID=UPI0021665805|nr:NFX1-type zinc finger-containing protein 1-like [Anthonomus grandis grandis]XP_050297933.1 NFX1-type zinc finger-containing protein 1-like [Anthonomus grandis grandis]XP_050297934.1 NFX1-type zinc finger-containing protein 1-like [Anthonomus grandis grandis]